MTKIKICGLSRPEDIETVNLVLPDYIGLVFANSKRQVNEVVAKGLKASLSPKIQAVGVFVNEEIKSIIKLCESNTIDVVQLHGDEDVAYIKQLKNKIPNKVIKAVRVRDMEDIKKAGEFPSDYLLFDAYREKEYGGSGVTFDWSLIDKEVPIPYFLAGGLSIHNVGVAMKQCRPYGLDISSGVETDGFKDENKIFDFVSKIRSVG